MKNILTNGRRAITITLYIFVAVAVVLVFYDTERLQGWGMFFLQATPFLTILIGAIANKRHQELKVKNSAISEEKNARGSVTQPL